MKLLDMTTEQSADVLCTISPLMDNIVTDKKLAKVIQKEIKKDDITRMEAIFEVAARLFTSAPILFGDHRSDIFGIIAAINLKTVDDIARQPLRDTISQIKDAFNDEEFRAFFTSFIPSGTSE